MTLDRHLLMRVFAFLMILGLASVPTSVLAQAGSSQPPIADATWDDDDDWGDDDAEPVVVRDYIEPVNRATFVFNDRLYYWVIKPVSTGYGKTLPEKARTGIQNFFGNIGTPARAVNCLLQRDLRGCGTELGRFVVNTTWGVLGFGDPAASRLDIQQRQADLGQTLGMYAFPEITFINWPVFGPSNVRDTIGKVGDAFLDPVNLIDPWYWRAAVKVEEQVNTASFPLPPYSTLEQIKEDPATFDFYVAVRNGYSQNRSHAIDRAKQRAAGEKAEPTADTADDVEGDLAPDASLPVTP